MKTRLHKAGCDKCTKEYSWEKKWFAFSGDAPITIACAFRHVTNRLRHIDDWNSELGFSLNRHIQKVHYP